MKKLYLFLLLIFMSLNLFSQMYVKEGSFKYIPNAVMDDKEEHTDGNDLPMALIKISTENIPEQERMRLKFSGNRATQVVRENRTGQVWIYITANSADFIKIMHPDYGTYTYNIPESLCDFCIYEMVLVSAFNLKDNSKPTVNYLIINTDQANAMIFIDDEFVGLKEVSKLLGVGKTHRWRVECDMYHVESGELVMPYGNPVVKDVKLRPAYGFVNVRTSPETNAMIYIDNKYVGKTPFTSGKLKIGEHKMVVAKEQYKPSNQEFVITDGDTTNMQVGMISNVVKVNVVTDSLSYIYVDNDEKDMGQWSGNVSLGTHLFEARKSSHHTSYLDIDVKSDDNDIIVIPDPSPMYGNLSIATTPYGANVYVDDKYVGQTPRVIEKILVGEHELKLEKDGYAYYSRKINIMEDETFILNETLSVGKKIRIETDSNGDRIYVDRQYVGDSPATISMTYGIHSIMVERDGYTTEEDFNVTQTGKSEVKLFFGKEIRIETDHIGDYVYVDNVEVGSSPCVVKLSFGKHNLTVKRGKMQLNKTFVVDKKTSENKLVVALGKEVVIKTTDNGDDVYIDNEYVGKTPLKKYLSFGTHAIKVTKGTAKTATKTIDVREYGGQSEFTLYYGQLVKLQSSKSGDAVFVDGKRMGNTPIELDMTFGNHKVRVKRHRKIDTKTLNITKNGNADYYFYPTKETLSDFIDNGVRYISVNASTRSGQMSYGISFGGFRKVGWYLSAMTNFDVADTLICTGISQFMPKFNYSTYYGYDNELTENRLHSRLSLVGGLMFKIVGPVYFKVGAGYGMYSQYVQTISGEWCKSDYDSFQDLLLSTGLQFNIKRLVLSADVVTSKDFKTWEFKVGLGFAWKKK